MPVCEHGTILCTEIQIVCFGHCHNCFAEQWNSFFPLHLLLLIASFWSASCKHQRCNLRTAVVRCFAHHRAVLTKIKNSKNFGFQIFHPVRKLFLRELLKMASFYSSNNRYEGSNLQSNDASQNSWTEEDQLGISSGIWTIFSVVFKFLESKSKLRLEAILFHRIWEKQTCSAANVLLLVPTLLQRCALLLHFNSSIAKKDEHAWLLSPWEECKFLTEKLGIE